MKYKLILLIFLICLTSSLILFFSHSPQICAEKKTCNAVQESKYSQTFGISNSLFGIIIFSFVSVITFLQIKNHSKLKKQIIYSATIIGSATAVYFIFLQKFIIKSYCTYCMTIDIGLIIGLLILILKND